MLDRAIDHLEKALEILDSLKDVESDGQMSVPLAAANLHHVLENLKEHSQRKN